MLKMAEIVHWAVDDVANPADIMLDFLTHEAPDEMKDGSFGGPPHATLGAALVDLRNEARATFDAALAQTIATLAENTEAAANMAEQKGGGVLSNTWSILWVLQSRFLRERSVTALNLPVGQAFIFAVVFALLYFQIAFVYSLAASLVLVATLPICIYALPITQVDGKRVLTLTLARGFACVALPSPITLNVTLSLTNHSNVPGVAGRVRRPGRMLSLRDRVRCIHSRRAVAHDPYVLFNGIDAHRHIPRRLHLRYGIQSGIGGGPRSIHDLHRLDGPPGPDCKSTRHRRHWYELEGHRQGKAFAAGQCM